MMYGSHSVATPVKEVVKGQHMKGNAQLPLVRAIAMCIVPSNNSRRGGGLPRNQHFRFRVLGF